ncbi:hypothetical protein HN789_04470 [archaeon]|jgi:replication factor A1|nr:hypothetical protein [archaeon]MBT3720260.1 hypothetical protein [archaeon]MBT4271728.1 hypothetical protein [archaeon]MBT4461742.1 hypothetical protein [archaeon]MBT4858046.1 hypothetical protein [archaeon]
MHIKDLEVNQGRIMIVAEIIEMNNIREFNKFGKKGKVCNAMIKDSSGKIQLTLWDDQIDEYFVNDKIKITNGYVKEWQGEKQLSVGKYGSIEKI